MSQMQHYTDAMAMFNGGQKFVWNSFGAHFMQAGDTFSDQMWTRMVSRRFTTVSNRTEHWSLKNDLIEHFWSRSNNK